MSLDTELEITPLGAAIVEAMPNQELIKKINRNFRKRGECPRSALFTGPDIRKYYKGKIKPV